MDVRGVRAIPSTSHARRSRIAGDIADGTTGLAYSQSITASNGAAPYSFAVTAGTLPPGIEFNQCRCSVRHTDRAGIFSITVTATDAAGCTGSRRIHLSSVAQD